MAGVVPVLILLDEASIYTLLDLALDPVDLVLWGGGWTPPHYQPFKAGLSLRSIWTSFLQDRGGGNAPKTS